MGKQKINPRASTKNEPKTQGNYIDTFVKRMFGRMLVFVDFLVHFADPKFVAEIDLRKIKPASTHYFGKGGDERIVDLIFQCPLKNGNGNLMAVIIFEHQNASLKKIPHKILKYISAIWDTEIKEGKKVLSAPYFIVLRTAKKPHRGTYPTMADSLPKGKDGKPVGNVVEVEYDVVDLPAWDFDKLIGGTVLRLVMGVLKKMIEGNEDEFPEALLPLREITDEEQQIELTRELLDFVAKAMAAHNRRLDAPTINRAMKTVFKEKGTDMMKTIFEEKYDQGVAEGVAEGEARGKAEGKVETVLTVLQARFNQVPQEVEKTIRKMTDPTALDSWATHAATCMTLEEFEKSLH